MKLLNTYEYIGRRSAGNVVGSAEATYAMISGQKSNNSVNTYTDNVSYGTVDDIKDMLSSHTTLVLLTPKVIKHSIIETTTKVKRSHISKAVGFDMMNPGRTMWSINTVKLSIDIITHNEWQSLISSIIGINSNYIVILTLNVDKWLTLNEVNNSIIRLPNIEGINLYKASNVALIDLLYEERSVLLDFRHVVTSHVTLGVHANSIKS